MKIPFDYDLYIFDVDDTICGRPGDLYPWAKRYFATLRDSGKKVALATNQNGVGLRYWMQPDPDQPAKFGDPERLPTVESVTERMDKIAAEIEEISGIVPIVNTSFAYLTKDGERWSPAPPDSTSDPRWRRDWRKPEPGMLTSAMALAGMGEQGTLFIGDQESDLQAAMKAGIEFEFAESFFHSYRQTWNVYITRRGLYGPLNYNQREAVDHEKTLHRFCAMFRAELKQYPDVGHVKFQFADHDEPGFDIYIEGADGHVCDHNWYGRYTDELISMKWLVYETHEDHISALGNDPRYWMYLYHTLPDIYGMHEGDARALIDEFRMDAEKPDPIDDAFAEQRVGDVMRSAGIQNWEQVLEQAGFTDHTHDKWNRAFEYARRLTAGMRWKDKDESAL